ncbi:MAG: hypothetical protein ACOZCO_02655 [Bacteroidota bacterium]
MKKLLFFTAVTVFLFSCGGGEKKKGEEKKTDSIADTTTVTPVPADTASEKEKATEDLSSTSVEELEKEGSGTSFCDCVKKQKEIDDQLAAAEEDKLIEELLKKSEDLRNGECIILKVGNQMTAAQKKERERKVKACLGE